MSGHRASALNDNGEQKTMQQHTLTLYGKDECPFAWKVRLALVTKQLKFDYITIDTDNKPAEFLALSPTGKVPLLVIDQELVTESSEIIHQLESSYPRLTLYGCSVVQRDKIIALNQYSDTVIGPAIRDAIFTQRGRPRVEWDFDAIDRSKQRWLECLRWLDGQFGGTSRANSTTFSDTFSLAECALLPRFALAQAYGLGQTSEFPDLHNWFTHHVDQPYFTNTAPAIALRRD
jgi:glutathione S-transferase